MFFRRSEALNCNAERSPYHALYTREYKGCFLNVYFFMLNKIFLDGQYTKVYSTSITHRRKNMNVKK